jgi:hypothetical protein
LWRLGALEWPPGIGEGQLVIGIGLLGALHPEAHCLAGLVELAAAAVDVEQQFGVVEFLRHLLRGLHRGLFVARGEEEDVAPGLEAFALELDQRRDEGRQIVLHVARAAAPDIAVLDHRAERIARPVGGFGLDHVHMARNVDRLLRRRGAAIARDQERGVAEPLDADILRREAARDELLL